LEHIGKVIFDIPFMVQSHAKIMKKILGALWDQPANYLAQPIWPKFVKLGLIGCAS
jgi:hypothetical protein